MRRFVKDHVRTRDVIVLCRLAREDDGRLSQESRTRVFHPAERKFWDENEIVFREREFVVEIFFEKLDAFAIETEDFGGVRLEFCELGFADVDRGLRLRFVSTTCGSGWV